MTSKYSVMKRDTIKTGPSGQGPLRYWSGDLPEKWAGVRREQSMDKHFQAYGTACKKALTWEWGWQVTEPKEGWWLTRVVGRVRAPRGAGHIDQVRWVKDHRKSPLLKSPLLKGLPGPKVPPFQSHSYELSMAPLSSLLLLKADSH